jgi:acetyltransferase
VLTTDAAVAKHLELARFSEGTTEVFRKSLPATANIKNPVDVIGDARADRYKVALSGALRDPNVDGTFVILTPQSMTDIQAIAEEVSNTASEQEKPVYASFMGELDVAAGISILRRHSIPHYILPESMCSAYAGALFFQQHMNAPTERSMDVGEAALQTAKEILGQAAGRGPGFLREDETSRLLEVFGLPLLPAVVAESQAKAVKAADTIGYPVVMKVSSDQITHKIDIQGVVLNIQNPREAAAAWDTIIGNVRKVKPDATLRGVLVQKMASPGVEVILGVKRDPSFGPVVMFGLGGSFVEVFKDVSFKVAPFGPATAADLVREIKAFPILAGARGRRRRDIAGIERCVLQIGALADVCPDIRELDINPLIVGEEGSGVAVADARILI